MKSSTRTIALLPALNPALNRIGAMFAGMALVLALAGAQGASASDRVQIAAGFNGAHGGLTSVTYRNRSSRSFRNGRSSQHRFSNRSNRNFRFHRNNLNSFYYSTPRYSTPRRNFSRGCQRVSKFGFWNGRRASVGGQQCIDSRGFSYIVPSSRFLIRYY